MSNDWELTDWNKPQSMIFSNGPNWLLKFCVDGTSMFNVEAHPHWKEDDFAREFIRILEECYEVTFNKKEVKPYPGFEDVLREK